MMALEHWLPSAVVQSVGWALLHSLWQGLLIAGGLGLTLRLLRKRSANVHYAVSFGALLLMAAAPLATLRLTYAPVEATAAGVPLNSPRGATAPAGTAS